MSNKQHVHTPESIIEVLKSINGLSVKNGKLEVLIGNDSYTSSINGYIPGSFTYELLVLIEEHLL